MTTPGRERPSRIALQAVLAFTAAVILLWGHVKLLDQDEVFVLQTDSVSTVRQLIEVQRHTPISLDPLFFHLLGHASVRMLGATAFAIRLPSLLGFLLMQVCLFAVARRIAGATAGVVAAAVPALAAAVYYGVEARPYGVLLGLSALVLLAWQRAVRAGNAPRAAWLATLAVALALALNTHYFAVLLMVPLCVAELYRSARLRRVDWPVVLAVVAGTAGEVFALPFQKAAGEFRRNYYNAGHVSLHALSQSYRALVVNYTDYSMAVQHAAMALLVAAALGLLVAVTLRARSRNVSLAPGEGAFLCVLAALPFFGFLLARFVTHSIEVRYVLPAILAVAVFVSMAMKRLAHRSPTATTVVLLALIVLSGLERVREEHIKRREGLAAAVISPEVRARLLADPAAKLYVQNVGHFEEAQPLLDPDLRSRVVLLYSRPREIAWLHHDTGALTAMHLGVFSTVPVQSYEALVQSATSAWIVAYPASGWDWIGQQLQATGADLQPAGSALGGPVVEVNFSRGPR